MERHTIASFHLHGISIVDKVIEKESRRVIAEAGRRGEGIVMDIALQWDKKKFWRLVTQQCECT